MKAKITGVRIQEIKGSGGSGDDTMGDDFGIQKPENVDEWIDDIPDGDTPERDKDGKIKEEDPEFKRSDSPGGGKSAPDGYNPGEVLRPGELGDLGGDSGLNGEALAEEWGSVTRIASSNAGNIPGELKRAIRKVKRPVIDWKKELSKYIDQAISKSKYTLPARRFLGAGKAQYGYKRYKEDFESAVIAIDTSGSITREIIEQFLGEVMSITQEYSPQKTVILYCDTQVYPPDILEPGDTPDFSKIAGGGGTYFWPPFKWVQKNMIDEEGEKPTVFIYFTDGEADFPSEMDYDISEYSDRCIWVFLTFNDEPYPNPQPFGERIDIILANKNVKRI
jgi:hypothetical protein